MKSFTLASLAQLLLASSAVASKCKPTPVSSVSSVSSVPSGSSSVPSAASYTPPVSSSSAAGGNGAATYTPPSSVSFSQPSFYPGEDPRSFSTSPPPEQSVSPCGQLVRDPEFAQGMLRWLVDKINGASLVFPGAANCGGGPGGDGHNTCGEFALGPTDQDNAHVGVSQTISAPGAIIDGAFYDVYVQYRVISNTAVDTVTLSLDTLLDGSDSKSHDLTAEVPGGWSFLHYQHIAIGNSMEISVTLSGSAGTAGAGFATTIQIGEINVVGCVGGATSII